MNATTLLETLHTAGVAVSVDGNDLIVKAPRGALSADLRAAITDAKPVLLAALKGGLHIPPTISTKSTKRRRMRTACTPISPGSTP